MESKLKPFTWDEEPAEQISVFESSTHGNSSYNAWHDEAVESRLKARREAAKNGLFKLAVLVVTVLGISGMIFYVVARRI
jgi:hypothetical protein